MSLDMIILAVGHLDDATEERTRALSDALGIAIFDARARVMPPAPRIVATYTDWEEAEARSAALRHAGFEPFLVDGSQSGPETRVLVRGFRLLPDGIELEPRGLVPYEVPYSDIRLMLMGIMAHHEEHTETKTVKKLSLGRTVMTGGLVRNKKKRVETTVRESEFQSFLELRVEGQRPFLLLENEMQYQGMGPLLQPSRMANFRTLLDELQRRCPDAVYDDRLKSQAGQLRLLGSTLSPERYLTVALNVLATHYAWQMTAD